MSDARNERRRLFKEAMIERGTRASRKVYAHKQVFDTAMEMAHVIYDEIMTQDNELYDEWQKMCLDLTPEKAEEMFCQLIVGKLLEPARATLAKMLGMAQYQSLHESIYDALTKDNVLRAGRIAQQGRTRVHISEDGSKITHH